MLFQLDMFFRWVWRLVCVYGLRPDPCVVKVEFTSQGWDWLQREGLLKILSPATWARFTGVLQMGRVVPSADDATELYRCSAVS